MQTGDVQTTAATRLAPLKSGRFAGFGDAALKYVTLAFGLVVVGLIVWIGYGLWAQSAVTRRTFGLRLITSSTWDVPREVYGALPFIYGTLVSSALALLLATPLAVGC